MKYLIVGLGNIGSEYASTRHNVGFMILDVLAKNQKVDFKIEKTAYKTEFKNKGRSIHLIKPTTYMNLSGKAVNFWMQQLKISKENVLVIVDDLALPLGKMRLRAKGSSAGHNGLKNIEEVTGGQNYARLKIGIGDNFSKGKQVDYVLGEFTREERESLPEIVDKACEMILSFCSIGIQRTMNQFND